MSAVSRTALAPRAGENVAELARRLESLAQDAAATALHLRDLLPQQLTCTAGPYRVFECSATGQFITLRHVTELAGTRVVFESDSFTDALAEANRRLAALTASRRVATRFADLQPALSVS